MAVKQIKTTFLERREAVGAGVGVGVGVGAGVGVGVETGVAARARVRPEILDPWRVQIHTCYSYSYRWSCCFISGDNNENSSK